MSEPKAEDIDHQGGWLVRVKTPPALTRLFYVYEPAWPKALILIKTKAPVDAGDTIEPVGRANIQSMTGLGITPGDVRQFG